MAREMNMKDQREIKELAEIVVLAGDGKLKEALGRLDQQEFAAPLDVTALLIRARLLEELDIEECWRTYTTGLEKFPDNNAIPLRFGVLTYKRGDLALAKQLLMRSWQLGPVPETAYYAGLINRVQGNEVRALEYFVQAVAMEGEGGHWRKQAERQLQSK